MPTSTGMQTMRPTVSRLGVVLSMAQARQWKNHGSPSLPPDRSPAPVPGPARQPRHAAGRAEMVEQRACAWRRPRDLIEHRRPMSAHPFPAMGLDREPMRLVAQPLDKVEDRIARVQRQRLAAGQEELLGQRCARDPWPLRATAGRPVRARPAAWAAASCPAPPSMTTSPGQLSLVRSGSSSISRANRRCSTSRIMA